MENLIAQILLFTPELLFVFGLLFFMRRVLFVKKGRITFAKVTEIQERQNTRMGVSNRPGNVRVVYHPVLKFEDVDSATYTCIVGQGGRFLSFNVGESVAVIYDPNNPNNNRLNHWFFIWPVPVLLVIMGAASTYLKYI